MRLRSLETINYCTWPEKDGLFDERIFGPTKDLGVLLRHSAYASRALCVSAVVLR